MTKRKNKDYWFKRRRYGFGWIPVTMQGWVVVLLFAAVLISGGAFLLKDTPRNTLSEDVLLFAVFALVAVAVLVMVSLARGPRPKWRWGRKSSDDPDEDF